MFFFFSGKTNSMNKEKQVRKRENAPISELLTL